MCLILLLQKKQIAPLGAGIPYWVWESTIGVMTFVTMVCLPNVGDRVAKGQNVAWKFLPSMIGSHVDHLPNKQILIQICTTNQDHDISY